MDVLLRVLFALSIDKAFRTLRLLLLRASGQVVLQSLHCAALQDGGYWLSLVALVVVVSQLLCNVIKHNLPAVVLDTNIGHQMLILLSTVCWHCNVSKHFLSPLVVVHTNVDDVIECYYQILLLGVVIDSSLLASEVKGGGWGRQSLTIIILHCYLAYYVGTFLILFLFSVIIS